MPSFIRISGYVALIHHQVGRLHCLPSSGYVALIHHQVGRLHCLPSSGYQDTLPWFIIRLAGCIAFIHQVTLPWFIRLAGCIAFLHQDIRIRCLDSSSCWPVALPSFIRLHCLNSSGCNWQAAMPSFILLAPLRVWLLKRACSSSCYGACVCVCVCVCVCACVCACACVCVCVCVCVCPALTCLFDTLWHCPPFCWLVTLDASFAEGMQGVLFASSLFWLDFLWDLLGDLYSLSSHARLEAFVFSN